MEDTSVKCQCYNSSDVVGINGALGGVASVMLANVGELEGTPSGVEVNGDGGSVKGELPLGVKALYCLGERN